MNRRYPRFLDKGLRLWIVKTARANYWRVAAWLELDDLIQEGFWAYAVCRAKYDERVENRRHFMALVKITYLNQITDLANKRTKEPEIAISQIATEGRELEALEYLAGGEDGDQDLAVAIAGASVEVRRLLALIASPAGQAALDAPLRRRTGGQRETNNDRYNRMLGTLGLDLEGQLRALCT